MRYFLLALFCTIGISASAQWNPFRKKFVRPQAEVLDCPVVARLIPGRLPHAHLVQAGFDPDDYTIEAQEAAVMKMAQHNMRFRVYHEASLNFTDLAHLYAQERRYSEAVWFLLQSNNISRQESDDQHTIENLIDIATIKAKMGEIALAQQDLAEAHDLATARGLNEYLETIDLAGQYITQNKLPREKPVLIYADDAQKNSKAE